MRKSVPKFPFQFVLCLALLSFPFPVIAQTNKGSAAARPGTNTSHADVVDANADSLSDVGENIPAGTTITIKNWQQYRRFLPDGMVALFEGKYSWKMPADVAMEIGPTVIHPLPKSYLKATQMYSQQVKVVQLPDGGLNLTGYQGGVPFPSPDEPHKGWKVLANLWFRYLPHISVDTYGSGCLTDRYSNVSCSAGLIVYRQLSYNTDPGIPATIPSAEGKFFTWYFELTEPEESRYTTNLRIAYTDLTRPESVYVFIPALRRAQPVSSTARCAPSEGTDVTPDDSRSGYESNITQVEVKLLGEKKIPALLGFEPPKDRFPQNYDMPLGWPKPTWGKWQLRDTYVISVSKMPAHAAGYCYGKRVMYVDKQFYAPLWEELYDAKMQPWKLMALFLPKVEAPGIGYVNSSMAHVQITWDIQNQHATFFADPGEGHPFYVNEQVPGSFLDLTRYTEPSGLSMIMR
jgi:Protein of unknown function (DUF1329)